MRTKLRHFFRCRHSLPPIVSYVRHTNRAKLVDYHKKPMNISYLLYAQIFLR